VSNTRGRSFLPGANATEPLMPKRWLSTSHAFGPAGPTAEARVRDRDRDPGVFRAVCARVGCAMDADASDIRGGWLVWTNQSKRADE
jgi:hypothetical protein